jgi:hypothetical protein
MEHGFYLAYESKQDKKLISTPTAPSAIALRKREKNLGKKAYSL